MKRLLIGALMVVSAGALAIAAVALALTVGKIVGLLFAFASL